MKIVLSLCLASFCATSLLGSSNLLKAAETKPELTRISETPEQKTARMKWFGEARFGMFIHWGLYSVPAGEYGGKTGYGEWIMESAKIPASQYEKYATQFNPVKFDAHEWARLAKEAGMKYMVITSKHHDGFAMFRSEMTPWCIKSTPFQRDPIKELAEACRTEGITFCVYHSIMDWHNPAYEPRRAWNDTAQGTPDMDRYVEFMKGELKELLTNYGPLGILWFDGEWENTWTTDRGIDLYNYVRGLQPQIIVNNRVGHARAGMTGMDKGAGVGDYGTPEQEIPATGFGPGVYWESCMTMNDHWGYNKHDQHWKSARALIHNLIDCASKGGNYLLNVGPTSEGLIPDPSIERLRAIGQWTKANGESVYGTQASPFKKLPWGRCTQRADGNGTILYLHVFDWPTDGKLLVLGLRNEPGSAALLASGKKLGARKTTGGVELEVPGAEPDPLSSTIVLRLSGKPEVAVAESRISPAANGNLVLDAADAELSGTYLRVESMDGKANIGYWRESGEWAQWALQVTRAGEYEITTELSGEGAAEFTVDVDGRKLAAAFPGTGSYHDYLVKTLGTLNLTAGKHILAVRPLEGKWQPLNLRYVRLMPKLPSDTKLAQ
jgi:alpha-L-fucosidase